jgi:hypothetical protein
MIENEYKVIALAMFGLCAQDYAVTDMLFAGHIFADAFKLLCLNIAWLDLLDLDGGHGLLGRRRTAS